MRDYEFLPYEKAVEEMAREYAKIKPHIPLSDTPQKEEAISPPFNSFMQLENIYCNNLEILILLRQLQARTARKELFDQIEHLLNIKTDICKILERIYFKASGKYPLSPVVPRLMLPEVLRRLIYLQSNMIHNISKLNGEYPELIDIEKQEIKASLILDNIIIIITSL